MDTEFFKELERFALLVKKRVSTAYSGGRKSLRFGHGISPVGYREYRKGDDFKLVDWKAYGRTEKLYIREHEEERSIVVHILLDASGSMGFDGFGIGGSFGRDEMLATLAAVIPHLPDDKPRHLLGIGTVPDIFAAIEAGVDTFDCVIPTREARHARLYTDGGTVDIRKTQFARDRRRLLSSRAAFGRLHRLFRTRDSEAGRLATLHNVCWFNLLLRRIRAALADGTYADLKRRILRNYQQ